MARPLAPQDLDPLDAAATPITPDPAVERRRYKRHRQLIEAGMSEEEAAAAMLAEDRAALPSTAPAPMDDVTRAAVGRGSLYPEEAELVGREREIEDTAESLGMPRQNTLPPSMRDAAAGNDMVGRFRFVHSPTGLRAVDTSPTPQEQAAEFRTWANQQPGSDRQATYDPASYAEWERKITEMRHRDYLADNAKYGSAEGPGWRDRLTPEQEQARADRAAAERDAVTARLELQAARAADPRFDKLRAKQAEQAQDLARRKANLRMMNQNPFFSLNDPGASDLQKQVLVDAYFRNPRNDSDPRVQVATLESQARERDRKATLDAQAQLAKEERDARATENQLARDAAEKQWDAREKEQQRQYNERSEESKSQFQERMAAMNNAHAAQMKEIDARLTQFGATNELAKAKADEERRVRDAVEKRQLQAQREAEAVQLAGPGGVDLVRGQLGTPAAQDALRRLAAASDQTWMGYSTGDAERFDATLVKLGITNPAVRSDIVEKYAGKMGGWPLTGGRNSLLGSLFYTPPHFPDVVPPQ